MPKRCNNCAFYFYDNGSTACMAAEPDAIALPNPEAETNCPHWLEIDWGEVRRRGQATLQRVRGDTQA